MTRRLHRDAEPPSRIVLVDDHPLFRQGLAQLISQEKDLEVCGEAAGSARALEVIAETSPSLAIVDLTLEDSCGLDLIRRLHCLHPDLRVLVVSMHDEALFAERALRAGAHGYVMKREAAESVTAAIRAILRGETYVCGSARTFTPADSPSLTPAHSRTEVLSDREFEVFRLIGQGLTPRQIAVQLHLSVRTIEAHREHIKKKLGIGSATELLRFAIHWQGSAST